MADISRAAIFGKLNSIGYKALEAAAVFCKMRGNPHVELVHWVEQILRNEAGTDLHAIVRHFGLNESKLAAEIAGALNKLPRGSTSVLSFSGHIDEAMKEAWLYSTLLYNQGKVRTGHVVIGILKSSNLKSVLPGISREFDKVKVDELSDNFNKITSSSVEETLALEDSESLAGGAAPGEASGAMAPAAMGKGEALKKFSEDLTEKARSGKLDPIVGRDNEIRQVVDILMRRRQNNPILTGEAGVGKTAVVEGFAQRVAAGDVPPQLKEVSVRTLDLTLLQAGASMKGEFEQRLRQVIEEVQASPKPIILFIDEAHTLIGAGGSAGQGDAANLLKPALARGTLRTIAATTWAEYKKYFEKDPALTRRFQVVKVDEPDEEKTVRMLRGLASVLEKHHRVQLLDEALESAVRLSHRYIPARQLPDKAVSLLDTACARVAVSQHAVPPEVDDCRRRIEALETELEIIGRESVVGLDHTAREAEVRSVCDQERQRLVGLESRWTEEKGLVDQILGVRSKLRAGTGGRVETALTADGGDRQAAAGGGNGAAASGAATATATAPAATATSTAPGGQAVGLSQEERTSLLGELKTLQGKLTEMQGETPLILPSVDAQAVAAVVADWTGIPVGRMVKNEIDSVLRLADTLEKRVIGQRHALDAIAKRIQTSRAGLDNPNRPIGVFLLAGPSGVGKTETALTLAEALYGGEQNVITINMSEFQEAHTVSTLKGAPPGYVGYGEGGILTEAVRRRPYSVVLLDEVEKAHGDVHEIFFQVFDKGQMEDGEGRMIDFKNTIILLTSNVGSDLIMNMTKDPELMPEPEAIAKGLREPLLKVFPAALLGRLVVIPYYPISDAMLQSIIRLQLGRIQKRLAANHKASFVYDDEVVKQVASRCTETQSGARNVDAILTHTMLPALSREFLTRMAQGGSVGRVHVAVKDGDFEYRFD